MRKKSPLKAVNPVAPAAGYVGGKRLLASRIVKLIETMPHETYAEVFCGMGHALHAVPDEDGHMPPSAWQLAEQARIEAVLRGRLEAFNTLRIELEQRNGDLRQAWQARRDAEAAKARAEAEAAAALIDAENAASGPDDGSPD